MTFSPGKRFRDAVEKHPPLQILGTINAYTAMLAQSAGASAIYLSGAGVANASYGLPDLGMTDLSNVLEDARRITQACPLPLLVDVDTGWGSTLNIARTVQLMEQARVAAIHIEDQIASKRCGHRPNKAIVSIEEMASRIKAAVDARVDPNFVIIARTDAYAVQGMDGALERMQRCIELGADMIFPEALTTLEEYRMFTHHLKVPVLANITEFGKTPLFTNTELAAQGVRLILYPLSAFRAMSFAALHTYKTILQQGTQKSLLDTMQNRQQLYDVLKYDDYEHQLNQIMEKKDE